MHACMYVCMYVYIYIYIHTYIHTYVCMYVCMYVWSSSIREQRPPPETIPTIPSISIRGFDYNVTNYNFSNKALDLL